MGSFLLAQAHQELALVNLTTTHLRYKNYLLINNGVKGYQWFKSSIAFHFGGNIITY